MGSSPDRDANRTADRRITLDPNRLAELRRDFHERTGRGPADAEWRQLVDRAVDEEILYREAVARGAARAR